MIVKWLIHGPQSAWQYWAYLAAAFEPCRTLIYGPPWQDTQ